VHYHAAKDSEKAADYCEGCKPGYELEWADADDVADAGDVSERRRVEMMEDVLE